MSCWRRKFVSEVLGTFFIVFVGCGSIMVVDKFPHFIPIAFVPLVFGLIVTAMIYSLGHISGAHFNPAVTLAFWFTKRFPGNLVGLFLSAQILGAILATCTLSVLLPGTTTLGATVPSVPLFSAFAWEFLLTFFLMFVVTSVATDARAEGPLAGVIIGVAVTLCAFLGGPITGASMNPARSFGPALFEKNLSFLWIYFSGPILGATFAAALYDWLRKELPVIQEAT